MGLKKRLFTMAVIACAAAAVAVVGLSGKTISQEQEESIFTRGKETIYFWYTDEALTDYLGSAAVAYGEAHDVRVIPVLASGFIHYQQRFPGKGFSCRTGFPDKRRKLGGD